VSFLPGWFPAVRSPVFPTITGSIASASNSIASSRDFSLPSSIAAGELLLLCCASANPLNTPSGWSVLAATSNNRCAVFQKTATGSEGATVTVSNASGTNTAAAVSYRISGWSDVEAATADSGVSLEANPNPPSLTPSWGAAKTLWLTPMGCNRLSSFSISAYPSGYGDTLTEIGSSGLSHVRIGSASLASETASQDPGTYTVSSNAVWGAVTVAVRPI
jgi:hypothetical protein